MRTGSQSVAARPSRTLARLLVGGALLLLALLAWSGSASAAFLHSTSSARFGPDGTEGTTFPYIGGGEFAVDVANRHLYELQEKNREGFELFGFSLSSPFQPLGGLFPEQLLFGSETQGIEGNVPEGLAVDNSGTASNGDIYYVASYGQHAAKLFGYSPDGTPLGGEFPEALAEPMKGCGVAVDGTGHIWVADLTTQSLREFASSGLPLGREIQLTGLNSDMCEFSFNRANEDLYIFGRNGLNNNTFNLWKYSAASNYTEVTEINPGHGGEDPAFDTNQQLLYVLGGGGPGVTAYNPDGVKIEEFGASASPRYMTEDEQTGTVYVIEQNYENYPNSWISVFPPTAIIPDVAAEGVEETTVHGTVKTAGGGNITSCLVEYGTNEAYGSSVPCEPPTEYTSDTAVSAELTGLTPEVRYLYRIKAGNANGYNISAGRSFVPHHVLGLTTDPPDGVTKQGASLKATYTGTNADTHFHFEWGTTRAYGNQTNETDDGTQTTTRTVEAAISGLEPGTTYHYRAVASNSEGTSIGEDEAFTSAPAVTDLTSSITDLKGNKATLNATWEGDATETHVHFEWGGWGTGVNGYAHVTEEEDAGSGAGTQHAAVPLKELQPRSYYHYRVVATNSSGTTTTEQGIFRTPELPAVSYQPVLKMTETSAELTGTVNPQKTGPTTYHFEYGVDTSYGLETVESAPIGSDNKVYPAAAEIAGLQPGTTYHYRLVGTSPTGEAIGPDRTFTTIPDLPQVTGTSASDLVEGGVTLNGEVHTGHGLTVVYFEYGPTTDYSVTTLPQSPLPADDGTHPVSTSISGLEPGTTYHFRVVAVNLHGAAYGPDETFTTPGFPSVTIAPASNVTQTSAAVSGAIDPYLSPTTYHFEYGSTAAYGERTSEGPTIGGAVTSQPVAAVLDHLQPGTTYHYRLVATNTVGPSTSAGGTFTTIAREAQSIVPTEQSRKCPKGKVRKHGRCVANRHKHRQTKHSRHHRRKGRRS